MNARKYFSLFFFASLFLLTTCSDNLTDNKTDSNSNTTTKPFRPGVPSDLLGVQWKLVAKAQGSYICDSTGCYSVPIEDLTFIPVENDVYQEFFGDNTFLTKIFYDHGWTYFKENDGDYECYFNNDTITYIPSDPMFHQPINYFKQRYFLLEVKTELILLYEYGFTTMMYPCYLNYKFIRIN